MFLWFRVFVKNRVPLGRSEIAENAKSEFAISVDEITSNRSKPRLPRSQIDKLILILPKDIGNSSFRFRANRGPFVVESNLCFLAVSKKSIFMVQSRIFGGWGQAWKTRCSISDRFYGLF